MHRSGGCACPPRFGAHGPIDGDASSCEGRARAVHDEGALQWLPVWAEEGIFVRNREGGAVFEGCEASDGAQGTPWKGGVKDLFGRRGSFGEDSDDKPGRVRVGLELEVLPPDQALGHVGSRPRLASASTAEGEKHLGGPPDALGMRRRT